MVEKGVSERVGEILIEVRVMKSFKGPLYKVCNYL